MNQTSLRQPFHRHELDKINAAHTSETSIQIIEAKQPITDLMLCSYLKKRRIDKDLANMYCHEVVFKLNGREKITGQ